MRKFAFFPTLGVLTVVLAACGSASTPLPPSAATQPPVATEPTMTAAASTLEAATQGVPAEATAQPVATSRGPNLEATDPTTVNLASGGLQFVEFFRFT